MLNEHNYNPACSFESLEAFENTISEICYVDYRRYRAACSKAFPKKKYSNNKSKAFKKTFIITTKKLLMYVLVSHERFMITGCKMTTFKINYADLKV